MAQTVNNPSAMWETWAPSLGGEDPLEKRMTTHSSFLAWRIPWTEDRGGTSNLSMQRLFPVNLLFFLSRSVISSSLWPHGLQSARLLCPWDFPGKNTEVGSDSLLPGTFLIQGSNLGLWHCRWTLYFDSLGKPWYTSLIHHGIIPTQLKHSLRMYLKCPSGPH